MTNGQLALDIARLSYSYPHNWMLKRVPALEEISLQVHSGECFGFLGHNGAGKTTSIKCILGLIQPGAGEIKIFGQDSRKAVARRSVGYLPEQPYFYDYLTVSEIMHMYACLAGISRSARTGSVKKALDVVGMSGRSRSPMRALSKGLIQRVALAQAILNSPKLLILDEPFSGLDPLGRKEFREILVGLKGSGTTIFMSSHILSDVEFLCDRVSIMSGGQIKGIFAIKEIPNYSSGMFELVLGQRNGLEEPFSSLSKRIVKEDKFVRYYFGEREKAEQALRVALEKNATIESYEFVHGSLEDLFVKLVGN
ncbi:MAG: multidrug ABC transporter ATP-binding protein [Proteobacteria bacterium]|nr:MAG: multidrug ABC transporter ATP-binding protein [Pseudomonadota bacterium]